MKYIKIAFTFLMHLFFFIIASILLFKVDANYSNSPPLNTPFLGLEFFSIVLYLYLWKSLYSKPYHIYLKGAFSLSIISTTVFVISFFIAEYLVLTFTSQGILKSIPWEKLLFKYTLFGLLYLFMIFLQFLWIISLARQGFFKKNTLIVGQYDKRIPLERLFQDLYGTKNCVGHVIMQDNKYLYRPIDQVDFNPIKDDFMDFLLKKQVNELILCISPELKKKSLNMLAAYCHEKSIGYYLISDIRKLLFVFPWDKDLRKIPIVERFSPNRDSFIMVSVKRIFDIFASAMGLILLSPVFLLVSAAIVLTDGFPIIYKSTRVGIHGKLIKFYKFRSMVKNAEALKADLIKQNERPDGPLFKMEDDPRVTKIGRILRKHSLDELPQLWNVLRGDMSLIGPRPHLPEEVAEYEANDHLRLECIPGISCLPQIRGRDDLGFRDWVNLDLEYRKNWTMFYDIKILWKTMGVVLRPLKCKLLKKQHEPMANKEVSQV